MATYLHFNTGSFDPISENAEENSGWASTDLWDLDTAIAEDMLAVLKLANNSRPFGQNIHAARL